VTAISPTVFEPFNFSNNTFYIPDALKMDNTGHFVKAYSRVVPEITAKEVTIDLSRLKHIDSAGTTAIHHLTRLLSHKNIQVNLTGASASIEEKLTLFALTEEAQATQKPREGWLYDIGEKAMNFAKTYIWAFIALMADVFYWSLADLFNGKQRRKGAFVHQAVSIGVNAVPIVTGLSFIIGLVLALQSAAQLQNFGANIFIVDLIVIAMMGEMGPLITAILVAGRSGSAIAAEIATMKVTSETDALQTMGLNPIRFVVVPKIYGSLLTMPFLTVLANVFGILGGMLAAYLYLDISPEIFFNRMPDALYQKDILTGIIKSLVFGAIVVLTGTFFGSNVENGAEGVGKATTKSVVAAIAMVIVADMILGLIFY
jgi:phospholipid/cholesterol/gamma-HCH transport system permease protein